MSVARQGFSSISQHPSDTLGGSRSGPSVSPLNGSRVQRVCERKIVWRGGVIQFPWLIFSFFFFFPPFLPYFLHDQRPGVKSSGFDPPPSHLRLLPTAPDSRSPWEKCGDHRGRLWVGGRGRDETQEGSSGLPTSGGGRLPRLASPQDRRKRSSDLRGSKCALGA